MPLLQIDAFWGTTASISTATFMCVTVLIAAIVVHLEYARRIGQAEQALPVHPKPHPYLQGNFAPIYKTLPLTRCLFSGHLPQELSGGQYVRNGGNPANNRDLGRDFHWFDGDGMLSGVAFFEDPAKGTYPSFVNQYVLTDVYLSSATAPSLKTPILPSVATLVNPPSSYIKIACRVARTLFLIIISQLPGSRQPIKKISVANTALLYHDGRALATGESGPPMRILLPSLDTIGWFQGTCTSGELTVPASQSVQELLGGHGPLAFLREWTTAHPRVDPRTKELILFHSTFVLPYVRYSVLAADATCRDTPSMVNVPIPGITCAKMMHDFGVSPTHTIILDLPLLLAPQNLLRNMPAVTYDNRSLSRFGVFPRHDPSQIRWFQSDACCIFHTANAWDSRDAVHLLACRLTSPSLVFSVGGLSIPPADTDQCRLYYYQFPLHPAATEISQQWALLSLPFEFPSVPNHLCMAPARYIYGCSSPSNFSAALDSPLKIDALVRVDVQQLIAKGLHCPPEPVTGCVDTRSLEEIVASTDSNDPVRVFQLPEGWYAQEPRFVPRRGGNEEDGWLLTYVFDESQLDAHGDVQKHSISELWVIDAVNMSHGMDAVIARVKLPQRVPYGFHGYWFSEEEVKNQRPHDRVRTSLDVTGIQKSSQALQRPWKSLRRVSLDFLK